MAEAVTNMVQKVCDHVKMEVSMKNYAQIEVFKAWHVKSYTGSLNLLYSLTVPKYTKYCMVELG